MSTTQTSPSSERRTAAVVPALAVLLTILGGCGGPGGDDDAGVDGGADMSACTAGQDGCACDATGMCATGLVCRDSVCAAATTCMEAGCLPGQTCTAATDGLLVCMAGSCEPGFAWTGSACQADASATCMGANSIEAACAALGRSCVAGGVGATCGNCLDGSQPFGSSCDGTGDCGALGCTAAHRACVSGPTPMCGACLTGYVDVAGTCTPSACADCATRNRTCDTSGPVAQCGGCLPGYALDGLNECAAVVTCESLGCAAQNRTCSMFPVVACADACVDGFVWDAGSSSCRVPVVCADLSCQPTEMCVEATGTRDAFCSVSCAPGSALDTVDDVCRSCGSGITDSSACSNTAGETGRVLTDRGSDGGNCFCEPRAGYFADESGDAELCDEDGDGWVTFNALSRLSSPEPRVSENMGCSLRLVNEVILRNDAGGMLSVPLASELPLYEPAVLDTDTSGLAYGTGAFSPAQLNSLTKACGLFDYNQNAVNDASEHAGSTPSVGAGSAADTIFARYMPFVYFVELHEGWFEEGTGIGDGRYVIRERSRSGRLNLVDASPAAGVSEYWRECGRHVDRLYETAALPQYRATTALGGDFASRGEGTDWSGVPGMLHHSQFRCVTVSDTYVPMAMTAQTHPTTVAAVPGGGNGVQWNDNGVTQRLGSVESCGVTGSYSPSGVDATNPDQPTFQCAAAGSPQNAEVYWAFVEYQHSGAMGVAQQYRRGCRNECDEDGVAACPTYTGPPPSMAGVEYWNYRGFVCDHDAPSDYGRIECGCGDNYSGIQTGCAMGCSDDETFFTDGLTALNRDDSASPRHWMCLVPTLSAGTTPVSGGTGYAVFRGAVPFTAGQTTDGSTLTGGGYVLRSRVLAEVNTVSGP